jgi:hypothetical protein
VPEVAADGLKVGGCASAFASSVVNPTTCLQHPWQQVLQLLGVCCQQQCGHIIIDATDTGLQSVPNPAWPML